jgi:hypothetical protein
MGEQLKKQTLFNLLESNSKNLFWVDKYVSGPEGEGGTYQTRRMTQEQFLQLIQSNINFNTGIKTFKNITGYPIEKGSLCAIDSPNGGIITAVPINSSEEALSHIYVATTTIANGTSGTFIEEGMITGIDTTSFTIGDFLYWHPSTKTISNTPESDKLFLGIVITTALLGDIYVSPTQNYSVVSGNSGQVALFIGLNHIESNSRFTFVDNVGTEVGFRFDDGNGNLTQVGCTYLNVESQGTASNSVLRLANWSDINTNTVVMRKARGTKSSPSGVLVNDILGRWLGTGQTDDGGGSTTFEMEVIAKDDYVRNGWAMYPEVYRMALTAFRIKLASSYDSGYLDISSIQNPIVFELDGDGNIKFKNYRLPATDGTPGQIWKTDGAGNITWANESGLGYTAENVLNKATNFATKNNILYPTTLAVYNEIVAQITALVNSSPATLDTLNELAAALGNDPNFATSTASALGLRELLSNKATNFTTKNNTLYPTTLAVYNEIVSQITALVNSSPATLDTLNELAAALGNDPNFATSMATALGLRELLSNKVTDFTTKNNTLYPTTLAVYNEVVSQINAAIGGSSSIIPKLKSHETFRGITTRNGSTTTDSSGGITLTVDASVAAKTIASTTYLTKQIRIGYYHTVVSTGHMLDLRFNGSLFYIGAGFRYVLDFGIPDTVYASGCRQFHGMQASTLAPTYSDTVQVDTLTDIVGIGSESTDTNLQVFYNDASGVASKIDLGASFPANRTAGAELTTMYSVTLYNEIGSSNVLYRVVNGETGAIAEGTISTNLPSATTALTMVTSRCMGSGGGNNNTGRLDIGMFGVYSVYTK